MNCGISFPQEIDQLIKPILQIFSANKAIDYESSEHSFMQRPVHLSFGRVKTNMDG